MFSRLNEAVPLAAAEKRNAFGGPLTVIFRQLAEHRFFKEKAKISASRYRHHDLVAKLLYLQEMDEFSLFAWSKWMGIEESHPLIGDLDLLVLILTLNDLESDRVRIHDKLRHLLGEDRVGDVPEVGLVAEPTLRILVGKIKPQFVSLNEDRVHDLYCKLVVVRNFDVLHIRLRYILGKNSKLIRFMIICCSLI